MKKMLNAMFVATLVIGGANACGSDDDGDKDDTETTVAESGGTVSGDVSSDNPDVAAYCQEADELSAAIADVLADPTKGDFTELSQQANDFISRAAQLTSANPSDTEEINACGARVTEAMTG